MINAVTAFERSFTPVDGGYIYYPSRWHGGYLVTQEEYEGLLAQWRAVAGWKGIAALVFLTIGLLVGVMTAARYLGMADEKVAAFTPFLAIIVILPLIWRSSATYRLVRRRAPVRPRRSSKDAELQMGRVLGRPMTIWIGVVSLGFLAWAARWALAEPVFGVPVFLLAGTIVFFNLRMIIRSFRAQ